MPDRESLGALLRACSAADQEERTHRDRMLELLRAPGDPFARDHYAPGHFTASSFVLSHDGERLLLIEHAKLKRWLQPGGHVDPSDADLLATAQRELREETGLCDVALEQPGIFDLDVHAIPSRATQPSHEHFDVRFLFRARSERVVAGTDAKAARWVSLGAIETIDPDRSVMRAVRKLLDPAMKEA